MSKIRHLVAPILHKIISRLVFIRFEEEIESNNSSSQDEIKLHPVNSTRAAASVMSSPSALTHVANQVKYAKSS